MNRIFKTIWSDVRQGYIVANEAQKTHGKPAKSAVSLAVAAATFLAAGVASAAYIDPGFVAQDSTQVSKAKQSWETDEYKKDWGLTAMNASSAYALGFHGQGVKVGVMDSGALMQIHPELSGDRFSGTHVSGEYGSSGNRYPQEVADGGAGQPYEKGEHFDVTGNWIQGVNDTHGTHVTGTVGGNRDGNEFHGVSWGSNIVVGNTGATDSNNYGPFQDYDYFYAGWKALADDLNTSNGKDRGGVINNSWGTNIRIMALQVWNTKDKKWQNVSTEKRSMIIQTPDDTLTNIFDKHPTLDQDAEYRWAAVAHIPTNNVAEAEYEYFLAKQSYANKYANTDHAGKSFVDAAYDAVKDTNVVQIFTTGNRDSANPFYRPLYPYFNPAAEKNWIAVGGLLQEGEDSKGNPIYAHWDVVNEAGLAKYWTVVAPGKNIYSSIVNSDGSYTYGESSGTSMAAPHVAGAMGVLMSRYQDMNAIQVRDVMFTTANHKNPDGSIIKGWENIDENGDVTPVKEGEVSNRMGWGVPDLEKGMYGPGQLLGKFNYNMANTKLDVWSNNISQVALDQRYTEEVLGRLKQDHMNDKYELGNSFVVADGTESTKDHLIDAENAKKWRQEYMDLRKEFIKAKLDNGEYNGSLVKDGQGTLVMTGINTYRGGTTVKGGTLVGFNDSFGVTSSKDNPTASNLSNGKVVVEGGRFGVINQYNDTFTMKGKITAENRDEHITIEDLPAKHSVDIDVKKDGAYFLAAGQDVTVGKLTFEEGAKVSVGSLDTEVLRQAYNGKDITGSVTADSISGLKSGVQVGSTDSDLAFFKSTYQVENKKLTGTLSRDKNVNVATYATSANATAIANVLDGNIQSDAFGAVLGMTKAELTDSLTSLTDDLHMAAQNATVVNSLGLTRVIKDQAAGIGQAQTAETESGARIWATGTASWGEADYGSSVDVDTYTGLVGVETDITSNTKVGAFFGYGSTDFDSDRNGKIESDDLHFGVYGETGFDQYSTTYGLIYTNQSRDANRALTFGSETATNAVEYDTNITQVFGEVAYTGLNNAAYSVEPYFGLTYMHVENDAFTESLGKYSFETKGEDTDLFVTSLGVRGAMPFTIGTINMQAKADLAWNHFFGDNEPEAALRVHDAGVAMLTGEELSDTATVGLGVEAQLTKTTTFGVNYTGSFGSDIDSHGIGASLRVNF